MSRRVALWVCAGLGVVIGGVAIVSYAAVHVVRARLAAPYDGYSEAAVFVEVEPGDSSMRIASRLVQAGVVSDDWTFRLAAWRSGRDRELQAGEYRFDTPLSPLEVVDVIADGRVHLRPVTFPEGLTLVEVANIFESRGLGAAGVFLDETRRVELIADLDPSATDLEGYLFPETYSLPRHATAGDLVEAMVAEFRRNFDSELQAAARLQGRTVRDVVTLASLIQKETGADSEYSLVSAVYNNRLRIGMGLQCDPTVIYALQLDGLYDGNLTRANLQYDSPYNTYRYPGLPPGPIAAAGRAALEAALDPADVPHLYFVSRNDGTHVFASTLSEHNRNVQQWQVEYFRARRRAQQDK